MSTTAEHAEHAHELEPHVRVGRARSAVVMFILSDFLGLLAILAGGSYLKALNTENQFRIAGDHAPVLLPGLLVAIVIVLSGLFYFLWERRARESQDGGQPAFYVLALVCVILALAGQTWVELSLGYTSSPFSGYESVLMLATWFTWVHYMLLIIIGVLLLGRILRGRLVGFGFIAEVTGYWWYYTALAGLLLWAFTLLL
jgi:heme/copper-type cytochrome/quinol oxidase subunit 4